MSATASCKNHLLESRSSLSSVGKVNSASSLKGGSSWNYLKIDFLVMYAELVIYILNQVQDILDEIKSSEPISLNNRCQNNYSPFYHTFNLVSRRLQVDTMATSQVHDFTC